MFVIIALVSVRSWSLHEFAKVFHAAMALTKTG